MLDALIVGGDSQIGKALIARLRQDEREVVATTRRWPFPPRATPAMIKAGISAFTGYDSRFEGPEEAVIEIYEAMRRVAEPSTSVNDLIPFDLRWPTWLPRARFTFFCTGINGFKPCEADPEEARRINVTLLTAVARQVIGFGARTRLVFLSSSAAETHPDTVYGTCKLDAEKVFLELGGACFRFGPVAFPGRNVYPNEVYSPINLSTLTDLLAGCFKRWEPGLHCIYNRDWVQEEAGAA